MVHLTEKELYSALRDCRNELCLKCGAYRNAHTGACDGCRWKEVGATGDDKESLGVSILKNRTAQFHLDSPATIWSYFIPKTKNPCGCGSNCYHYEHDGKRVIGVCNACGKDIYEVKEEFADSYLLEGVWKEIDKPI